MADRFDSRADDSRQADQRDIRIEMRQFVPAGNELIDPAKGRKQLGKRPVAFKDNSRLRVRILDKLCVANEVNRITQSLLGMNENC